MTPIQARISTYAALIVVLAGLFLLIERHADSVSPSSAAGVLTTTADAATSTPASIPSDSIQPPPNSKEYQSNTFQFSLYYPDDLTVSEQPGAAGSIVVLFDDRTSGQGFDIFIVPYDEPKITQATFLMDEPSGVMNVPQNITIDGAPATAFFSTNSVMGASREIWFLHGGFLYEITAPKALDQWLLQIMETWQFL